MTATKSPFIETQSNNFDGKSGKYFDHLRILINVDPLLIPESLINWNKLHIDQKVWPVFTFENVDTDFGIQQSSQGSDWNLLCGCIWIFCSRHHDASQYFNRLI